MIDLDSRAISNASKFVWQSRKSCFAKKSLFVPHEDAMLHECIKDGFNYNNRNFVATYTYSLNKRNRQSQLRTAAMAILRHGMFTLNIPSHSLNTLWVLVHILMIGRALPMDRFSSANAIWNNIMQQHEHNSKLKSIYFAASITELSNFGFCQYFRASSASVKPVAR